MSLHPSYISPKLDFGDQSPPLKPGKRYGIYSILCGLMPIIAIAFTLWIESLDTQYSQAGDILMVVSSVLSLCSLLFIIIGIFFGVWGLDTEGRRYAIVGLLLNALPILGVITSIMFTIVGTLLALLYLPFWGLAWFLVWLF